MTRTQDEATRRVESALRRIEAAQNLLNDACSDISPVLGLVREWEAIGKVADKTKAMWHRLNRRSGPFDLDDDAARSFLARLHLEKQR